MPKLYPIHNKLHSPQRQKIPRIYPLECKSCSPGVKLRTVALNKAELSYARFLLISHQANIGTYVPMFGWVRGARARKELWAVHANTTLI